MSDDDELIEIPKKIPKLDVNVSINESETCNICLEAWTTSGDHKIVSIKCGHVFGQKCIESWLQKSTNKSSCPMCKRSFSKKDIRPLFLNIKTVLMEDNSELIQTIHELSKAKKELYEIHDEYSKLKLMNQLMTNEMIKLQEENKRLLETRDLVDYQHESSSSSNSNKFTFQLMQKLQISAIGNCRVMDYSHLDDNICVSCPSSVRLVTGYGVRVIDVHQARIKKYIPLHASMIRNVEFSPFCSTNLMLSCSLDKYVKMTSTNSNSIVASFMCSNPVWSCTWSNNNNIVYAGLANGVIEEIDNRNLSSPVSTVNTQSGGPIVSMRYVCGNDYLKDNGLIVTNFKGVTFHHNSLPSVATHDYSSLTSCKTDTLLISSHYNSSLIHTAFNQKTYHMLNTFRPSNTSKRVKYLFSAIGSNSDDSDLMYASDIKSFDGATTAQFMSRSCFLTSNVQDSANYAVTANEEKCTVQVWDLRNNYDSQVLFPKEVTPQKPIIDLCQYSSDPVGFAALNSDNLYLYRLKS